MEDHFFVYPIAILLLLFLIPFFWGEFSLFKLKQKKIHLFSTISQKEKKFPLFFVNPKVINFSLIWCLLVFAFMWPVGNPHLENFEKREKTSKIKFHEIIFLVDTSASMDVKDGNNQESRLEQTKVLIENFLESLDGETASLYAFTSVLTPIVPATIDYLFLKLMTNDLSIDQGDVGGTEFLPVLETLKAKLSPNKEYSLFLFSDGGDNKKMTKPFDWGELDLSLYTIGIGSTTPHTVPNVLYQNKPVFSKLEADRLKALGGQYFSVEGKTLWTLSENLIKALSQESSQKKDVLLDRAVIDWKNEDLLFDLYYQIPLGVALFLYGFWLYVVQFKTENFH